MWSRAATELPPALRRMLWLCGLTLYVGIVVARGGPPPTSLDTASVVGPTSALADGRLAEAAGQSLIPQPPGYPLLAAPFVLAFRPVVGSATWCSDRPLPAAVEHLQTPCRAESGGRRGSVPPPWYRSQAVLGVLAWIALAAGAVALLRAAGAGGGLLEAGLVLLLAVVPAASDALVQTFHPQDLVCVGLVAVGLAATLRRRWVLVGLVFGLALLCKQFALLPLVAVLVVAPGWRQRARVAVPVALVVAAGVLPFLVGNASQTLKDIGDTAVVGSGSEVTGTLLGLAHLPGLAKLTVARDGPIAASLLLALWACRRAGSGVLSSGPLVGLALACLATRLVFEVVVESYYLLAVSAVLLVLDLSLRRLPLRSLVWIALSSAWVAGAGAGLSPGRQGAVFLVLSLSAVVLGALEVPGRERSPAPVPTAGAVTDPMTMPAPTGPAGVTLATLEQSARR